MTLDESPRSETPALKRLGGVAPYVWVFGAILAAVFYTRTYHWANPTAALSLTVGRQDALARTQSFLERQGLDPSHYRSAIAFGQDSAIQDFLETRLGLVEANRVMLREIPVWYWRVRYFVPRQDEQFGVWLGTDGRLAGYTRHLDDDAVGESLSALDAQHIAEEFLTNEAQIDLSEYALIGNTATEQRHRLDHGFTWRKGTQYAGATYHIAVTVSGKTVALFGRGMEYPEAWRTEQTRLASQKSLFTYVAKKAEFVLGLALLVVFMLELRAHRIRFRFALILGCLSVLVQLLSCVNWLSFAWMDYSTTEPVSAFYSREAFAWLTKMLSAFASVVIAACAAEALGRRVFTRHIEVSRAFAPGFWSSRGAFTAVLVGLCLALMHLAYVNAFYLAGGRLGVWAPQRVPDLNQIATALPWVYPLSTGFSAALSEEFLFRLFAISLIVRLTKQRWLAVLLPAMVWAFMHSAYPQNPAYVRGLELTVVGVVYGVVFLRYGIVAPFIAHYTYNALASSVFLLGSGNTYFVISGTAVAGLMLVPALPGLWRKIRGKELHSGDEDTGAPQVRIEDPNPAHSTTDELPVEYLPFTFLPKRRLWILAALGGAGLLVCFVVPSPARFGDFVHVTVNRWQAERIADAYLESHGVSVRGSRKSIAFHSNLNSSKADYVWQQAGLQGLNEVYARRLAVQNVHWHVSYFLLPLKEAYEVLLGPEGDFVSCSHEVSPDKAGAHLTKTEAETVAERYLRGESRVDLDNYRLVDSRNLERSPRSEYTFVWEDTSETIGDARFRIALDVSGDEAGNLRSYLELPEQWLRARRDRPHSDTLKTIAQGALSLLLAAAFVVVVWRLAVKSHFLVRPALYVGVMACCVELLGSMNTLSRLWGSYSVTRPPSLYVAGQLMQRFIAEPIGMGLLVAFLAALSDAMFRHAFPGRYSLFDWLGLTSASRSALNASGNSRPRKKVWAEAILIACFVIPMLNGADRLVERSGLFDAFHGNKAPVHDDAPHAHVVGGYDSYLPALSSMLEITETGFICAVAVLFIAGVFRRYLWSKRDFTPLVFGACLWAALFRGDTDGYLKVFGEGVVGVLVVSAVVFLAIRWIYRDNLPAYFLTLVIGVLSDRG
ncbi:MAG: CPBP family intramembrane metalloprotease [Candidatus Hydrogenedentes bacterium]|nr:CPBP family intramembrane metalloprotease [Candidatus Hydrogenedentota bacterium]